MAKPAEKAYQPLVRVQQNLNAYWFPQTAGNHSGPLDTLGPVGGSCITRGEDFILISSSTQSSPTSCSTAGRKRSREGPEDGLTSSKRTRTSAGPSGPHVEVVYVPSPTQTSLTSCSTADRTSIADMAKPAEKAYQPLVRVQQNLNAYWFPQTAGNHIGPLDTLGPVGGSCITRGEDFILISSSTQSSPTSCSTAGRKRSREGPEDGLTSSKRTRTSAGPSGPHVEVIYVPSPTQTSLTSCSTAGRKRIREGPEDGLTSSKRTRTSEGPSAPHVEVIYVPSSTKTSLTSCSTAGRKRTREGLKEGSPPSKRTRTSAGPPAHHVEVLVSSKTRDATWISVGDERSPQGAAQISPCIQNLMTSVRTDSFEVLYQQLGRLGRGGYGSVYAGYRKQDGLPVAIKRIPMGKVEMTLVELDGKLVDYPMEAFLMLKAAEGQAESEGPGSMVNLINWCQVDQELILVQERPRASVDLFTYMRMKGNKLQEQEAKMILHQVVNGVVALHAQKVLHRDIKPENILVGTASGAPLVRIIDLGCGCHLEDMQYSKFKGTLTYVPPEWVDQGFYRADPMTVWQMGVLLFELLTGHVPFQNMTETLQMRCPPVGCKISPNCQDFLDRCLNKRPLGRPPLRSLLSHPWLHFKTPGAKTGPRKTQTTH